jgi:hypothetical protein
MAKLLHSYFFSAVGTLAGVAFAGFQDIPDVTTTDQWGYTDTEYGPSYAFLRVVGFGLAIFGSYRSDNLRRPNGLSPVDRNVRLPGLSFSTFDR